MENPLLANNATFVTSANNQSIDEALRQWNLARATLAASLQTYMDAFSRFEVILPSLDCGIVKPDVLPALDEEVVSLAAHEDLISATRMKLLRLKNISRSISPIARLPTEILARVFTISVDSCRTFYASTRPRDQSVIQVNTVASVCSYWRNIAINTPSLWSYIDFDTMYYVEFARLWLQRARTYPLDIVTQSYFDFFPVDYCESSIPLVYSQVNCLRSMYICSEGVPIQQLLSGWCTNGIPHTLTTLTLRPSTTNMLQFPVQGDNLTPRHLEGLFYSLTILNLHSVSVDWDLMTCRNLVTLNLEALDITIEALYQLLTANSELQHVSLTELKSTQSLATTASILPSIQLNQLRTLQLVNIPDDRTAQILAVVAPGNCGLTLLLDPYFDWASNNTLRREFTEFCKRSPIKMLSCFSLEQLRDAVTVIPALETLVLEQVPISDALCDVIAPSTSDDSHSRSQRLPNLHSLYIFECHLKTVDNLGHICSSCPIHNLIIREPLPLPDGTTPTVEDFERWIGPGINVSAVPRDWDVGFPPFSTY